MKLLFSFVVLAFTLSARGFAADSPSAEVIYFDHAKVDDGFAKGLTLVQNSSYRISTSRRVAAGTVEVHEHDTDIFYVIEGSATFVTGGNVVEPKTTGPSEVRGKEITGGTSRTLAKGDVIVVPSGVPHWFKAVPGPFIYFLVKVTK